MKKIVIIFLSIFIFVSCWSEEDKQEQPIIEETWDIVDRYIDTLEWSIEDAKETQAILDARQQNLKDNLNVY